MSESDTSAKCLVGSGGRYDLFRYDRDNRKGGGVAIFWKRVLNPVRLNFPEDLRAVKAVCIELTVAFDIIALSETWLNENTFNLCNIEGYVTESKHRDRVGGGVALLVKQPLEYCVREDVSFCNEFIESLFIEIHLHNQPKKTDVVIGVIYRPPDTDINSFVAIITDILSVIKAERKTCYILGDFNINLINVSNHIPTAEFLELMYSHAFTPLITKPTRVTSNTATLIDNIFTNSSRNSFNGILLSDISDHFPIFCINITTCVIRTDAEFKQQREYKTKNIADFSEKMRLTNWQTVLNTIEPQLAYSSFQNIFMQCYESCFPIKRMKSVYKSRKPWLSNGLIKSIKTKNQLYVKYLRRPTIRYTNNLETN